MRYLVVLLFYSVSAVTSRLPLSAFRFLGSALGILWFDILRIRRRVVLENLRLAFPDWSEEQCVAVARESLCQMGHSLLEFTLFPELTLERVARDIEIRGRENVEEVLKAGHGLLMLSLHLGNGDLGVAASSITGLPMTLISKRFRSEWLNELWFGLRARHGTKFISPEKSSFDILRALGRNEAVIFVLDQFMGPPVGVRTTFFGRETGTAMGLALIQLRTQLPVVISYTYRTKDRFIVEFARPLKLSDFGIGEVVSDKQKTIALLTQKYTDKLEELVREHPEQWMWLHRRWKPFVE